MRIDARGSHEAVFCRSYSHGNAPFRVFQAEPGHLGHDRQTASGLITSQITVIHSEYGGIEPLHGIDALDSGYGRLLVQIIVHFCISSFGSGMGTKVFLNWSHTASTAEIALLIALAY